MIRAIPSTSDADPDAERGAIRTLKYDYVHGAPIDDGVLDGALADVRRVRELSRTGAFDALRTHEEIWAQWRDNPERFMRRVVRHIALYVTAESAGVLIFGHWQAVAADRR